MCGDLTPYANELTVQNMLRLKGQKHVLLLCCRNRRDNAPYFKPVEGNHFDAIFFLKMRPIPFKIAPFYWLREMTSARGSRMDAAWAFLSF